MLDQRGTGRSTPIGTLPGLTPAEQADRLAHFRADAIVRDAEHIRRELGVERWSVLGQSFGGLCVMTYLSIAPEGLREAFVTGGLAPIGPRIDDVYRATYRARSSAAGATTSAIRSDRERVRALHEHLDGPRRPPALGRPAHRPAPAPARQPAGHERRAPRSCTTSSSCRSTRPPSATTSTAALGFARNPLYAVLQEACWADGGSTRWAARAPAARRVRGRRPSCSSASTSTRGCSRSYGALAPLREAADILAAREWPRLYDPERLAANEVPVAAAIYAEDMYVERAFSEETAARIRGLRPWLTNEYEHNGLRADGARVLGRLIDLTRGRA